MFWFIIIVHILVKRSSFQLWISRCVDHLPHVFFFLTHNLFTYSLYKQTFHTWVHLNCLFFNSIIKSCSLLITIESEKKKKHTHSFGRWIFFFVFKQTIEAFGWKKDVLDNFGTQVRHLMNIKCVPNRLNELTLFLTKWYKNIQFNSIRHVFRHIVCIFFPFHLCT